MKPTYLPITFFFGLSLWIIGTLIRIQQWGDGEPIILAGIFLELVFWVLVFVELFKSTKVNKSKKIMWGLLCLLYVFCSYFVLHITFAPLLFPVYLYIGGNIYLKKFRKRVLFSGADFLKNQFDSI